MNSQAEVEQWEALDLGDSELPSYLRTCKRKSPSRSLQQNPKAGFNSDRNQHQSLNRCSSRDHILGESYSHSLVPGPAGTVQVAIRRKMNKDPRSFNEDGEPIPTQEFIRKAAEEPDWEDKDFSGDLWVSAVEYIQSEGLLSNGGNAIGTPVSEIKRRCDNWGKVDQVVAIIKSCTPNGLGDIMVTLKDPTGTIDASVHRKVISESEFGRDIRVGSVVILKKVAVCTPSRSSCYLNITLKNISKVIAKDTPVSPNQNDSEMTANNHVPVNEIEEYSRMQPRVSPVEQGTTTQGIMNNLRKNAKGSREALTDVEMEETNPLEGNKNQCEARMEKSRTTSNIHKRQLLADVAMGTDTVDGIREVEQISRRHEPHIDEQENVMRNSNEVTTQTMVHKSESIVSTSSLPQWTDEQLEELFAFD